MQHRSINPCFRSGLSSTTVLYLTRAAKESLYVVLERTLLVVQTTFRSCVVLIIMTIWFEPLAMLEWSFRFWHDAPVKP